jgi:hypothetical protein
MIPYLLPTNAYDQLPFYDARAMNMIVFDHLMTAPILPTGYTPFQLVAQRLVNDIMSYGTFTVWTLEASTGEILSWRTVGM